MTNNFKKSYYRLGGLLTVGMMFGAQDANASSANSFNNIAGNINDSISTLPGLISALAYLFGVLLAVLGVMKIKDHVENPSQTPLKDGAIRLAAGGALFSIPILLEAMSTTIGDGAAVSASVLKGVTLSTS